MSDLTAVKIKAKKLGVLLRSARQNVHHSVEESAQIIDVSPEEFQAYELGERSPSLPQLEMLAYTWGLPADYFWGSELSEKSAEANKLSDKQLVLGLRQRVIGVMLRKARTELKLSLDDMEHTTGISAEKVNMYELGQISIPLPELEILVENLGSSLRTYRDQHGPMGVRFNQQQALDDFNELPPDLQVFVTKPINRPFLELARRLSEMDVKKLRTVAEGLLEITL